MRAFLVMVSFVLGFLNHFKKPFLMVHSKTDLERNDRFIGFNLGD